MNTLPPIEKWWPALPAHLKQEILSDPSAPLSQEVIEASTPEGPRDFVDGVDDGYDIIRLTPREREYIAANSKAVN